MPLFIPIVFSSGLAAAAAGGTWTATGALATPRHVHTATLLPCGR